MSQDIEPDHVNNTRDTHEHSPSDISPIGERRNITISVSESSNFPNGPEASCLDKEVFVLFTIKLNSCEFFWVLFSVRDLGLILLRKLVFIWALIGILTTAKT